MSGNYLPTDGWQNKAGTSARNCSCGSWKEHWKRHTGKPWPNTCSVYGCNNTPTLGAHVHNATVIGERIVATCDSCNKRSGVFSIKGGVSFSNAISD
jgi:hypothetical protein